MRTYEFDFELPESLIAQHPPLLRGESRLLCVKGGNLEDLKFSDLPKKLKAGDVLVLNDTRVIKARLFGVKQSGGKVEVLIERIASEHEALVQIRASKPPKAGSRLVLGDALEVEVLGREGEFYRLRFSGEPVFELLERHGKLPLPPYISHAAGAEDEERYQTVFARMPGAVAAPTAGLHFDDAMLNQLRNEGIRIVYVTLHVGAGTFQPVRAEYIYDHAMHSERYEIPEEAADAINSAKKNGGRVIAVGTTSLRALESAADGDGSVRAGSAETDIYITPGYRFKVVDVLLTNFHLPKSTLLMLVSAFGGMEEIRAAYRHAVKHSYRFFSYGDAMLIEKKPQTAEK